jgi:hypothetical protein
MRETTIFAADLRNKVINHLKTFTTMKKQMQSEDIISMEAIKRLLEQPLSSISERSLGGNKVKVEDRDITSRNMFGKTFYLVYQGQLRQFRIKKGIKFPFNWKTSFGLSAISMRTISNIWIIDVAGIGELAVDARYWGYAPEFEIYESIEHFKANEPFEVKRMWLGQHKGGLEDIYKNIGIYDEYLCRWYWNGTRAEVKNLSKNISLFFTYDENGFDNHMEGCIYGGYATKEECEKDNAIKVAVFADEAGEEEKEFRITFTSEISVNAKSKAEAMKLFEKIKLYSETALNHGADYVEVTSIEEER